MLQADRELLAQKHTPQDFEQVLVTNFPQLPAALRKTVAASLAVSPILAWLTNSNALQMC